MTSCTTHSMCLVVSAVALGASLAARSAEIQQAGPSPQERVAALKQAMQESQTKLRQYEWNRRVELEGYFDYQHDTGGDHNRQVYAIGTVLNLYF
jgi:hypothetical protein